MEIVEVEQRVELDSRVLRISHVASALTRGLEPGEELIVSDAAGEFHAATVSGIEFELEDTVYTLEVGARLPLELVEQRRRGLAPASEEAALHDIVDLLGKLRGRRPESGGPQAVVPRPARPHKPVRAVAGL